MQNQPVGSKDDFATQLCPQVGRPEWRRERGRRGREEEEEGDGRAQGGALDTPLADGQGQDGGFGGHQLEGGGK